MAIDRKDYQYIHNTLEKKSITNNDNTLKVGSKVKNLLVELKDENITIIITSHYQEDIDKLCDIVYEMDFGKIELKQ